MVQVIGAGWGRTGTDSLKLALVELGLGPAHHMYTVMRSPSLLCQWVRIGSLKERSALRDQYLMSAMDGFHSALDGPVNIYFEDLARLYPNAVVILTKREPKEWYESAKRTIFLHSVGESPSTGLWLLYTFNPIGALFQTMLGLVFHQVTPNPADEADTLARYSHWVERVRESVPQHRLLEFSVTDGWGPLCEALNVSTPSVPFPRSNSRHAFHQVLFLEELAGWATLGLYLVLLWRLLRTLDQR